MKQADHVGVWTLLLIVGIKVHFVQCLCVLVMTSEVQHKVI